MSTIKFQLNWSFQARIVGGVETAINEFPSMAALITKRDGQIQCGAKIIDQYYALTAAHCVNSPGKYADQLELLVGEHDYRNRMCAWIIKNRIMKHLCNSCVEFLLIFHFTSIGNAVHTKVRSCISCSTPQLFIGKGYQ